MTRSRIVALRLPVFNKAESLDRIKPLGTVHVLTIEELYIKVKSFSLAIKVILVNAF